MQVKSAVTAKEKLEKTRADEIANLTKQTKQREEQLTNLLQETESRHSKICCYLASASARYPPRNHFSLGWVQSPYTRKISTVEPRFNGPLYNEVLGKTIFFSPVIV